MAKRLTQQNEGDARKRRLKRTAAATRPVTVRGLVSAGGAAGVGGYGRKPWTLVCELIAWRIEGDLLELRPLKLEQDVSERRLEDLMVRLAGDSVVRLRVRVATNDMGESLGILDKVLSADKSDVELMAHAKRLLRPISFVDKEFGKFTFDRRLACWSAKVRWNTQRVALTLEGENRDVADSALKTAKALWKKQKSWNERITGFAIKKLLPLNNKAWLRVENDEKPVTSAQFAKRMKLESIQVYQSGNFEFWYDDGELFYCHCILVAGNLSDGPTHADILG